MGTFCHSDQLYTQPIIPSKFQGLVFQAALYLQHIDMCAVTVDTSPATTASMLLFFFFSESKLLLAFGQRSFLQNLSCPFSKYRNVTAYVSTHEE